MDKANLDDEQVGGKRVGTELHLMGKKRPNIIVVFTDQQRWDSTTAMDKDAEIGV